MSSLLLSTGKRPPSSSQNGQVNKVCYNWDYEIICWDQPRDELVAFCKALPSGKWLVINWRVCQTVICKLIWGEGKSSHSSDLVEIRCGLQIALYMEMRVMDRLQAGHVLWGVWIRIANLILSLIILQEIAVQKIYVIYIFIIYIYISIY